MSRLLALTLLAAALAAGAFYMSARSSAREAACVRRTFEASHFIVCTYNARRQDLQLASRDGEGDYLRNFPALREYLGDDAVRVRFAMNAGMFNDTGAPIGLYVEDGVTVRRLQRGEGPGNFHLMPNGVFSQDEAGALRVETTDAFAARGASPRWASQSGPMLVIGGALHPAFGENGASRYVRNGVGVRDAATAYFVISEGAVSFGRFARFFRDALRCDDALFFDGAVSSLWSPDLGRMDRSPPIGPMVIALERSL
jgi:uncharacterized protein YigE (DUF2233 family)